MTILLTGFTPFPDVPVNPSGETVEAVAGDYPDVIAAVLPTSYRQAGNRIRSLIADHQPAAVLLLGVAESRPAISLERFALNVDDASKPDNDDDLRQGTPIEPDGPPAYRATLPLERIASALGAVDLPVMYSNHAGAYVCNHLFYVAADTVRRLGSQAQVGFIHVPAYATLPPERQQAALRVMLDVVGTPG
jgi:pyroglutamyl-peptidase